MVAGSGHVVPPALRTGLGGSDVPAVSAIHSIGGDVDRGDRAPDASLGRVRPVDSVAVVVRHGVRPRGARGEHVQRARLARSPAMQPGADMQREVLVEKEVTRSDNISISSYAKDGINIDFSVKTDGNNGWVQLPLFYYDDYYAVTESGDRLKVYSDDRALLYVEIPENMGEEMISVRFGDSWIYSVPLYISVAFIAATFMALLLDLYKRKIK